MRMAGVNVGKVKVEGARPGRAHAPSPRSRSTTASRRSRPTRARSCARRACWGRPTWSSRPAARTPRTSPTAARCRRANVEDTVELDEVFRTFDPRTRRSTSRSGCTRPGIASTRRVTPRTSTTRSATRRPFFEDGADLLRPLDEQEVALRRLVRDTGRVFDAISREDGAAARADRERRGHLLGARLARRRAGRDLPGPAHLPARDARDGQPARAASPATPTRWCATCASRPTTWRRRCATSATCRPTSRSCSATSTRWWTPRRPACRRPSASSRAPSRCSSRPTCSCASSTRSWPTSPTPQVRSRQFLVARRRRARRAPARAATRATARASTTCRSSAIIDGRSLAAARADRPPWERGNAYVAPNAYDRAIPLGVIESFDCDPNGGEQRNPSGVGRATPSRPASWRRRSSSRTRSTRACGAGQAPRGAGARRAPRATRRRRP